MRSFVPFGKPWKMPISVPYSFLVRDEELAWTCGQIPADAGSNILAYDDLVGQTKIVCEYIEDIFSRGGLKENVLGKLVLYYVAKDAGDAEKMLACCRSHFGDRPVLVPIAVPHFYFDGMLLEVDAFAGVANMPFIERTDGQSTVKICDGGELAWATVTTNPNHLTQAKLLLDTILLEFGLSGDQRLNEHWIAPPAGDNIPSLSSIAKQLGQLDLISDEGTLSESTDPDAVLVGEITFAKQATGLLTATSAEVGGVKIIKRQSGRFAWFSARSTDASQAIVAQTSNIMAALAKAFDADGLDFTAVVKSTSLYVGGSSEEELFDNMTIRNGYYKKPGPASTGLPVMAFADSNSQIVVDLLTVRTFP